MKVTLLSMLSAALKSSWKTIKVAMKFVMKMVG